MGTSAEESKGPYWKEYIPNDVFERLESGAFNSLCTHLQDRSDEVQNIDLMALSGFCRNCLAKWMVLEARKLSDEMKNQSKNCNTNVIQALDAFGYDEAAEFVYGMGYKEWKGKYNKKATDQQLENYNNSKLIQATHDKELLKTRTDKSKVTALLASNVCCMDVDDDPNNASSPSPSPPQQQQQQQQLRSTSSFIPPPIPPEGLQPFNIFILTVSDRASKGEYETGDLSGPAVKEAIEQLLGSNVEYSIQAKDIVPDNVDEIVTKIKQWTTKSDEGAVNVILTSGGTGFSPRDVTPEATKLCIDKECHGLMSFVLNECARKYNQPLAHLSRGMCGITATSSIVANLPGNPKGVHEIVPILLPMLLHIILDLQ